MDLLKPKEAARLLNISYPTIKQWIYQDKIRSVKTPGGHHRIPLSEIERLTDGPVSMASRNVNSVEMDAISLRNKIPGRVSDIHLEGLFAQIKVAIGEHVVTAIIPRQACQEMDLKKGQT
ncbi:MAG: helix-turn-helix domain-containing protein, partial [Acidobacteria bacterium]|nr:helix-turn-helix domain-containing protein [Acidobacteriota bacterium]